MARYIPVVLLMLVGALIIAASVKNWDFFFESRKAARLVKVVGRQAARIIYGIMGAVMCGMALYMVIAGITGVAA